jgi:hypothetical protein
MKLSLSKPLLIVFIFVAYIATASAQETIYFISLLAVDDVDIRDPTGSVIRQVSPHVGVVLRDVHYDPGTKVADAEEERRTNPGRSVMWAPDEIWFVADAQTREIRFRTTSSRMMEFEIRKGTGINQDEADLLIRYADMQELGIKPGRNARFVITSNTVSDLQLDNDGNGTYETRIRPQFRVTGLYAKDELAPRLTMSAKIEGNIATITLAATDAASGVKSISYQIGDGNPNHPPYRGPFKVDITREVVVFAIADDHAGNRVMEFKYFEAGREKVGYDPHNMRSLGPLRQNPGSQPPSNQAPRSDPYQLKSKPF